MERIVRDELVEHLENNNLFQPEQHGFRKGKSCTTQLLECMEDWTDAVDNKKELDIIYLDFKAAFDKVPHLRLLNKIWHMGIRGKIYNWLKNFLQNRTQRVMINGKFSSWQRVTSGVPQGSVLGPILFIIFINDLPQGLSCSSKLFADDTKLYMEINPEGDENCLQDNIFSACDWANKWEMTFNSTKCKTLCIGKKDPGDFYVKNNDGTISKIERITNQKDLGVIFDQDLSFQQHISAKVNLANRNLGIIRKKFTYMNKMMFLQLYKSLVRPHLEYASVIWTPKFKKDRIAIENVQRRATKIVRPISHLSYPERLKILGLPSLEYRRERSDLIQTYKLLQAIDITSKPILKKMEDRGTRGHCYKLYKTRFKSNVKRNCFSNRIVDSWNKLPNDIVTSPTVNTFKSRLNKQWKVASKFYPKCYQQI